ncbi:MAG: anthranilate synthase component I family protein [Spirochaetes bacterium]|nr:anthranilate synthase component I family protein [Spirochaetota bacterium]
MHILKLYSDLETPVSTFMKVALDEDHSFLLESAEHEASFGRFSFIGAGKREEIILSEDGRLHIRNKNLDARSNPLGLMTEWLTTQKPKITDTEIPFFGGVVGYISYNYVKYIEDIKIKPSGFADFHFIVPEHLIVFDHVKNQISILSETPEVIVEKMNRSVPLLKNEKSLITEPKSNYSRENFYKAVEDCKNHIIEGDIFQVVLSQRFNFKTTLHPFSIYRALRMINPSPYMFYLKFNDTTLLGSSPEMMSRLKGTKALVKPIAGTRKRGRTIDEDLKMEQELTSDEKEKAEHVMLVDLGRNDLGRVCQGGSVHVDENMIVERYSHVMHMVSQVSGLIEKGKNSSDVFQATFPAGTVSGAPKVRAMEIINDLEPDSRGPYAGAVAYFSYPDEKGQINMDSGIMIRSLFFKGEEGFLQAGAGIVYDSKPDMEYKETLNKLQALFKSLEVAQKIQGGLL